MSAPIKELTVEGFKSIRKLDKFELPNLNVLIGANGAGKSNFVEAFRLIREVASERLHEYIRKGGGGDGFFFGGPKETPKIGFDVSFGVNRWEFVLEPTADGRVALSNEFVKDESGVWPPWNKIDRESTQSNLGFARDCADLVDMQSIPRQIHTTISAWGVYHFHDTSSLSPMRREQAVDDMVYLRPDASNIAAFLLAMRRENPGEYTLIRDTIRTVAPFFDDFLLKERWNGNQSKVALDWRQKGSDFPFQAWHLSDGTLRFICLATTLLQPNPPPTVVIDEPELGLHPHALEILAGLLQKAAERVQVIVSTQSAPLLSQFEPRGCDHGYAKAWGIGFRTSGPGGTGGMDEGLTTLGELWQKNVVEAGASDD